MCVILVAFKGILFWHLSQNNPWVWYFLLETVLLREKYYKSQQSNVVSFYVSGSLFIKLPNFILQRLFISCPPLFRFPWQAWVLSFFLSLCCSWRLRNIWFCLGCRMGTACPNNERRREVLQREWTCLAIDAAVWKQTPQYTEHSRKRARQDAVWKQHFLVTRIVNNVMSAQGWTGYCWADRSTRSIQWVWL